MKGKERIRGDRIDWDGGRMKDKGMKRNGEEYKGRDMWEGEGIKRRKKDKEVRDIEEKKKL